MLMPKIRGIALLLAPYFEQNCSGYQQALRDVVAYAGTERYPGSDLRRCGSSTGWLRAAVLPANLIQAQRHCRCTLF
ncbi:hypothetical protein ACNKHN_11890 [Shigella flexneri]